MIGRREEIAAMQSVFYRNRYHGALRGILFSLGIIFFLILIVIYSAVFVSPLSFYGTATSGQLISMDSIKTQ